MTGELKVALSLSVGLHVGAMIGLPMNGSVEFDVERAPTSVEIVLLAPMKPEVAPQPEPLREPILPQPDQQPDIQEPDPVPRTVVAVPSQGALADLLPSYLRNPPPVYPTLARERGYEGTVVMEVEVLPSGRCGEVRVERSSGHAILDHAAVQAVRRWRFQPASRLGRPTTVRVEIPVTFRLIEEESGR